MSAHYTGLHNYYRTSESESESERIREKNDD